MSLSHTDFYDPFHGHSTDDLQVLYENFVQSVGPNKTHRGFVYLAGDSSLDNKYWFTSRAKAVNGYEKVLRPPKMKTDIAYWVNKMMEETVEDGNKYFCLNTAVEESTIGSRACGRLLEQDQFIKEHITPHDVLVVSVGGNDIALAPNCCTIVNMLLLLKCATKGMIANGMGTSIPCDDSFCGFGCSCLSTFCAWPLGTGYFIHLFKNRIEAYLKNLTCIHKPRKILVCMIYYVDENSNAQSWANSAIKALGYDTDPEKLQTMIRMIFKIATSQISIPGTEIVPVPLFCALDGKNASDYIARVEPSASGGEVMSQLLMTGIMENDAVNIMHTMFATHEASINEGSAVIGKNGINGIRSIAVNADSATDGMKPISR